MEEKDKNLISTVTESDVPALIQQQFVKMESFKEKLTLARKKAEDANIAAKEIRDSKTRLLKMKTTLEQMQEAQVALSEATLQNTEAQELSFEYQRVLAEVTKYLFGLGVTNISVNRCVVKELQMRIEQASEEEIDEMARNELINVVRQLKEQEDILQKQKNLEEKIKLYNQRIDDIDSKISYLEDKIDNYNAKNENLINENEKLKESILISKKKNIIFLSISFLIGFAALIIALICLNK